MQPSVPAVKTSNHMRKSKRFLRVPLLHLLNFYNLVDCHTLGSRVGLMPLLLSGREKQKKKNRKETDRKTENRTVD